MRAPRARAVLLVLLLAGCASKVATPADGAFDSGHDHDAHSHAPVYLPDSGESAADKLDAAGVDASRADVDAPEDAGNDAEVDYAWDLPEGMPPPAVPDTNPMSQGKVELGRFLFYDPQLSDNGTQACASCHEQARGFAQSIRVPMGSTGQQHARNSMPLANVAFLSSYTWVNPTLLTLEKQIAVPIFGDRPVELGVTDQEVILARLRDGDTYPPLFKRAFPEDRDPVSFKHIVDSLACFLRSLISLDAPYDRYQRGDDAALSESAKRGMNLFFGEDLECHHCHNSFMFSNAVWTSKSAFRDLGYNNTGLYNLDETGAYPDESAGLYEFTGLLEDQGKFRAPSLRNVGVTAPYFHDGSAETLEEVIRTYESGGRRIESGPYAGDGRLNPNKSGLVPGFELTDPQRADLIAFLQALTDETFLTDPRHASPFD